MTSSIRSSSPGQFGFTCSRRDKPQHAGADLAHVRGGSAADLHADAERLVPPLHKLGCVYGSAEEPGGASPRAIDSPLPHALAFQNGACVPPEGVTCSCRESCRLDGQENGHYLKLVFNQL